MIDKIFCFKTKPRFTDIPVHKLTFFSEDNHHIRPFSQCGFCLVEQDAFILKLYTFDINTTDFASPNITDASHLSASISLDQNKKVDILYNKKNFIATLRTPSPDNNTDISNLINLTPFQGEDLQGVYYGFSCTVPLQLLTDDITLSHTDYISLNLSTKRFYNNLSSSAYLFNQNNLPPIQICKI